MSTTGKKNQRLPHDSASQLHTRKVRIDTGPTIMGSVARIGVSPSNGSMCVDRYCHLSDYDQNSSSSNSSASYPTKEPNMANKLKGKSSHSDSTQTATITSSSQGGKLLVSYSSTHPKGAIHATDSTLISTKPKSSKVKSSPKHLLYEVLMSPIKRKSRDNKSSSTSHKSSQLSDTANNKDCETSSDINKQKSNKSTNQPLTPNTLHSNNPPISSRSSSTTPFDRNFYNFQTGPSSSLFDDDPGIMSEIETSATGFRRGNKIRSSLPIVRTPSKSQDRSLGLVFLQFRSETKRALLPNEITSIDTVKALFVRSFPRQLTMEYLDFSSVRIYIHDQSKDMFYELEDLRDVKDRCILRIYEQGVNGPQPGGGIHPLQFQNHPLAEAPETENYGYFSEPEFDSEYQSQHIHRKRLVQPMIGGSLIVGSNPSGQSQYYGTIMLPPHYRSTTLGPRPGLFHSPNLTGQAGTQPPTRSKVFPGYSQTLPRGSHLMSPTSLTTAINNPFGIGQPPPKPQRTFANSPVPQPGFIMIQGPPPRTQLANSNQIAQPYHQNRPLPDRPYSVAGHYPSLDRAGSRFPFPPSNPTQPGNNEISGYLSSPEHRSNNTGTVLPIHNTQPRASFSAYPSSSRSILDGDLPSHSAQGVFPHSVIYGTRQAPNVPIDEEARIRMQEMERQIASLTNVVSKALTGPKPPPPPKPASLVGYKNDLSSVNISGDNLSQLRQIRRKARDLRTDVRNLKRLTQQQTNNTKEMLKDTCGKIRSTLSFLVSSPDAQLRFERLKISSHREDYNQDAMRLDKDLSELEAQVEELRSNVINRRCRVNISNVESMALILSRASKTVADLKARFPSMAQTLKSVMAKELQQIELEEKFLKQEPDRLEHSLKRCKKLTGTLVTLKRLASVQEQRSSSNPNTSSPSQMLQSDKKDGSGDENSTSVILGSGSHTSRDPLMTREKRMQSWRRSVNFRQPISSYNYKIDLCRGFASMPTIQEPNSETVDDDDDECSKKSGSMANVVDRTSGHNSTTSSKVPLINSKSYDGAELMEPHTIIQVTPATPSSTDSSKTATSNMLDNLLDELQTFSKQPSVDAQQPTSSNVRSSGSLRALSKSSNSTVHSNQETVARKAARSKSYSSIRANSEPPGSRTRGASIPDGKLDLDGIAFLASSCGNAAAATAALVEKRFAQSRQELLEQRHQELLRKQRQLQEQYTRLQQLSRGQIPRGLLSDLKKTGSENNIVSKTIDAEDSNGKISRLSLSSTVHGSLRNLSESNYVRNGISTLPIPPKTASLKNDNLKLNGTVQSKTSVKNNSNGEVVTKKVFETDIL